MTFSLEQTTVTLNGHTVTGWSDDTDALSLPSIDLSNVKRGASGEMVATTTGEKGGPVTIKLLPNSPSVIFVPDYEYLVHVRYVVDRKRV